MEMEKKGCKRGKKLKNKNPFVYYIYIHDRADALCNELKKSSGITAYSAVLLKCNKIKPFLYTSHRNRK